jgi:hypothetical protein
MAGIVKSLDSALKSNNLDKVAATMNQFERQFEDLDVQSEFVEQSMQNQAVLSTPEDDVNLLVQQVGAGPAILGAGSCLSPSHPWSRARVRCWGRRNSAGRHGGRVSAVRLTAVHPLLGQRQSGS